MVRESIEIALKDFGLTEKEGEIYLFLAKRGAQKTGQIAKHLKKNKGLIYRILKNLQQKGVVEKTLESPTRYIAVPFEKVIDSYIKLRRQEAAQIEKAKNTLLSDWNRISQTELDSSLEKFGVIEGNKKIYKKISQMLKETEKQLTIGLLVSDLLDAERLGLLNGLNETIKNSMINFRVLTQISKQNLKALKILRTKFNSTLDFRGTNHSLGLSSFSRVIIRDNEEIILFISDERAKISGSQKDVCLVTNCKSIIQAFSGFFDELWKNSITIEDGIIQIETGKSIPQMLLIKDAISAKRKFEETLDNSQNEILIVTSSDGLIELKDWLLQLRERNNGDLTIRIMAPIIDKNLEISQNLLEFCEVKHIPSSYTGTVIIDGKHLFQFKHSPFKANSQFLPFFKNTLYTNDIEYIEKTKNMLNDLWKKAPIPSNFRIESLFRPTENPLGSENSTFTALKNFRRVVTFNIEKEKGPRKLTEKDVLNKILKAKTGSESLHTRDAVKFYASTGQAIIRPPEYFKLPDMMLHAFHVDKQSTNGGGDSLVVFLWLDTPSGFGFVPVAIVGNNSSQKVLKRIFQGTPAENNFHILNQDKFSVRIHGNTLFAVWTEKIPLIPPKYTLPPSCFKLEGFGKVKTGNIALVYRSGFKNWMEFNALEALVTFYHPSSKYSGPGTDGILFRDYIGEHYIPPKL